MKNNLKNFNKWLNKKNQMIMPNKLKLDKRQLKTQLQLQQLKKVLGKRLTLLVKRVQHQWVKSLCLMQRLKLLKRKNKLNNRMKVIKKLNKLNKRKIRRSNQQKNQKLKKIKSQLRMLKQPNRQIQLQKKPLQNKLYLPIPQPMKSPKKPKTHKKPNPKKEAKSNKNHQKNQKPQK